MSIIKNLAVGAALSPAIWGLGQSVTYVLKPDLYSRVDFHSVLAQAFAPFCKQLGGIEECARIILAECPYRELANQFQKLGILEDAHSHIMIGKAMMVFKSVMFMPIVEEVLFRGFFQGIVQKWIPGKILQTISPQLNWAIDHKLNLIGRIALNALIFSYYHNSNRQFLSDDQVDLQVIHTLVIGICFGALKESRFGLMGAIGAHMGNNLFGQAPFLLSC